MYDMTILMLRNEIISLEQKHIVLDKNIRGAKNEKQERMFRKAKHNLDRWKAEFQEVIQLLDQHAIDKAKNIIYKTSTDLINGKWAKPDFCQCKEPEAIYRSRSEGGKGGLQCNVCGKEVNQP